MAAEDAGEGTTEALPVSLEEMAVVLSAAFRTEQQQQQQQDGVPQCFATSCTPYRGSTVVYAIQCNIFHL